MDLVDLLFLFIFNFWISKYIIESTMAKETVKQEHKRAQRHQQWRHMSKQS